MLLAAATVLPALAGCQEAERPAYGQVVVLEGTPYERGFQHGQQFASRIRSLYTSLLASSILPYLNRERPDIASVLVEYQDPIYDNGQFSYQLMLQSGKSLEPFIPPAYVEEMHGIADGSGVAYDQILILNTFLDTMLGFRSMTFFLRKLQSPAIRVVQFTGGLESDGIDNDCDGEIDEELEGRFDPYEPLPHATAAEVPTDAVIRILLEDKALMAAPEGVNPDGIRIQLGRTVYESPHPSIQTSEIVDSGKIVLEVLFTPPGGLPEASIVSLLLQAGDLSWVEEPPPAHGRFMRDERIVFTTRGFGKPIHQVENRGEPDGRTQPPSISFAVRDSATSDAQPLLAHHFAMLDSNTSHKHSVVFLHKPSEGIPHAVVSWAGLVGGFSGMNARGLAYAVNSSDSLDNPMTAALNIDLFGAKLNATGVPIQIMGRYMLEHHDNVNQALQYLQTTERTYGWNVLLQDASGAMKGVEIDGDILDDPDGGFIHYDPDPDEPLNLDAWGNPLSSVGPDDLFMSCQSRKNVDDIELTLLNYQVLPQRYWTSFYFRSLRAYYLLREKLGEQYGTMNVAAAQQLLGHPDLVDSRDSMNAVVFQPAARRMSVAMGEVPATAAPFQEIDLAAVFGEDAKP